MTCYYMILGLNFGKFMVEHKYNCTGIKLFKFGPYQLELWICKPLTEIPPHVHPDMDSHIVHLFGKALIFKENKAKLLKYFSFFNTYDIPKMMRHGFQNMNNTFVFLNFEFWYINPTSASINLKEI